MRRVTMLMAEAENRSNNKNQLLADASYALNSAQVYYYFFFLVFRN